MGSGGQGHAPTQIDPSPRVSATGCEDGRRLNMGSGGRGHAPTQILINDDDPSSRVTATGCEDSGRPMMESGDQRQRGQAPYPNADNNNVLSIVGSLEQLCPQPRDQVYGDSAPVLPDWLQVQERRSRPVKVVGVGLKPDMLELVADINVFARQKKGGTKDGPIVHDSAHCILCGGGGAVCLGPSCKGKKKARLSECVDVPHSQSKNVKRVGILPGLSFVEDSESKTSKSKR